MKIVKLEKKPERIHKIVREYYAAAITGKSNEPSKSSCCGGSKDAYCSDTKTIYEEKAVSNLPPEVTDISFGCGDPVTLAALKPGQTVLDLGSGGGIDCFLAGRKVGSTGHVIGVDMTPQMIDRARENKEKLKADNVEFRLGEIEHLPVADQSVDVVISNCVINLSVDKQQVFHEIYRVLKPGGRLAVSDIVTDGSLPEKVKNDLIAWAGCISGALDAKEYLAMIEKAGFVNITMTPVYFDGSMVENAIEKINDETRQGFNRDRIQKSIFSAKIKAEKCTTRPTG